VSGSGNKIFYPSALNNAGTINWTGGNLLAINNELGGDQVLINNLSGGVFNVQSDANLAVACPSCFPGISLVFTNSGLIRKSGTTGTNSLGFNYNLDTVDVQSGTLYVSPGYTQAAAGTLKIQIGGLTPSAQHGQLVVNGPATLDGALQVSFSNNFVAGNGDFFNILSYASRSGGFASSSAGALGLTESYTSTNLLLIAGSNAYPSLSFTVMGGNTQTVCVPFQLLATAADADGAVTNVAILLDGSPIASAVGSPVAATAEIDFPGVYTFTAQAQDDKGDGRSATQTLALVAHPLHVLTAGGFRTNGAFKLCIVGETNHDYQVLASTNLSTTNWVIIGVMEPTNGIWRFLDTGASNQPFRFYRAEQLP